MPDYIPLTFGIEALYPPLGVTASQSRDIYMMLADTCRFTEFRQLADGQGCRLAESNNRSLTIAPDRFIFNDEYTRAIFPTFVENMSLIHSTLREILKIPVLLHCKVLVRMLMPYQGQETTIDFFQKRFLNSTFISPSQFDRPCSGAGIRMIFPPVNDQRSSFQLRIEPYFQDIKLFFLENTAQFFDPITDFKDMENCMNQANNFVKEQAGPFVLGLG